MRVVGVTGRAGSGKDTVADILVRDHGFCKVAFADVIKRICREVFAFTDDQLWGSSQERNREDRRYPRFPVGALEGSEHGYLTPRYALQRLGTEWGRDCYPDVWVNHALSVAARLLGPGGRDIRYHRALGVFSLSEKRDWSESDRRVAGPYLGVVIPDFRFPNEVAALRKAGGVLWMTTRGDGLQGPAGAHESERHVGGFHPDLIFPDDMALEEVPRVVAHYLEESEASFR